MVFKIKSLFHFTYMFINIWQYRRMFCFYWRLLKLIIKMIRLHCVLFNRFLLWGVAHYLIIRYHFQFCRSSFPWILGYLKFNLTFKIVLWSCIWINLSLTYQTILRDIAFRFIERWQIVKIYQNISNLFLLWVSQIIPQWALVIFYIT